MINLFIMIAMTASFTGVLVSLSLFVKKQPLHNSRLSMTHFAVLAVVYANVMFGFAVVYLSLELLGVPVLKDRDYLHDGTFLHAVEDILYFSAVTLLTVGYGDIIPQGIGRWIAMAQALIGYLLPVAFVVTTFIFHDRQYKTRFERGR